MIFSHWEKVAVRPDEGDIAASFASQLREVRSVKNLRSETSGRVTLTRRANARRPLPAGEVFWRRFASVKSSVDLAGRTKSQPAKNRLAIGPAHSGY